MVSFDLSELPWSDETFIEDRVFLMQVVASAKARVGWERLGFAPLEVWLQPCLDKFDDLIEAFAIEHVCKDELKGSS